MYTESQISNMMFIDVETVSSYADHSSMEQNNSILNSHWKKKANALRNSNPELCSLTDAELYKEKAALYTEFSKIITISVGMVGFDSGTPKIKVFSYSSEDELKLLTEFNNTLFGLFKKYRGLKIVGHNIIGFDIPLILRKFIKHCLPIPDKLMLHDIKPWDSCLIDTNIIWKFGSWSGASLDTICAELDIPSPKEDIDGSQVSNAYWNNNELERITAYCESDVKATANVILRMACKDICE